MSPENFPGGYIVHRPDCQNPQAGWVPGSKEEAQHKREASGEGYYGCITCGGPAMIGNPEQSKSTKEKPPTLKPSR